MAKPGRTFLAVAIAVAVFGMATAADSTAPPVWSLSDRDCPTYPAEGGVLEICSGEVPSFDGAPLDVDLTKPFRERGHRRHPLIVMLHGFSNDKHEWESVTDAGDGADKWRWNSHWFARHGYYVLTYTARGFRTDAADDPYEPGTPPGSSASLPNGTIHLKSREFELRDTQWLAALAADTFPGIDPDRVAVTGGSYGGGESWLQASEPDWTFAAERTGGDLPVLRLQVAVPKYGWSDLAYSLGPNGHPGPDGGIYDSAQHRLDKPDAVPCASLPEACNPIGTIKLSYVNGFYALGLSDGLFEAGTTTTPSEEGPINIHVWKQRLGDIGDPYDAAGLEDAVISQARRGLTEFRGAYYQDEAWTSQIAPERAAIFAIQGWTDDLFTAVEAFRQFKYLKRLDPRWPVEVALADVGHPRAQNKDATWRRLNTRAFRFLESHIDGSRPRRTGIWSEPTLCSGERAAAAVAAATPEGLAGGALAITYGSGGVLTSAGGTGDPDGFETDPVLGDIFPGPGRCRESRAEEWPGRHTAVSPPLEGDATYVGLGTVTVPYTLVGGTTATLNARLWDVATDGTTFFVDRGSYRIDVPAYDAAAGTLELPLFGNHWRFEQGHRIRLDLVQVDEPFLRRSNVASSIVFGAPTLRLPIR
jgi:dienelactone hydrolase